MDLSLLNGKEVRIRLEDAIKALDEIGVPGAPEFDTPSQRIRALAEMLATRIHNSQVALDAAADLQQSLSGHELLANAAWQPFPEVPPPTDRDVLVFTNAMAQVVVRWDPKPDQFFTTFPNRVWVRGVIMWRECVEGPTL